MRQVTCPNCQCQHKPQRGFRPVRTLMQVLLLYIVLVFGGGTLKNTSHPVAIEVGRLMQTVTLVDPTIRWADGHGHQRLAGGLRVLAEGASAT